MSEIETWVCNNEKVSAFVNAIAPIVLNEYCKRIVEGDSVILPSVCIAQAALESGWNINATTLFGIKGNGVLLDTTEYVNGEYVNVRDSFVQYPSIADAVRGYYNLMQYDRYNDATACTNYVDCATAMQSCGYATDPEYAHKLIDIINDFNLDFFDSAEYINSICKDDVEYSFDNYPFGADIETLAWAVIRGEYGNNPERKERITSEYDEATYNAVQSRVNQLKENGEW